MALIVPFLCRQTTTSTKLVTLPLAILHPQTMETFLFHRLKMLHLFLAIDSLHCSSLPSLARIPPPLTWDSSIDSWTLDY